MKNDCDILVIGAGPAGSCAAGAAAERGLDVLLIDRKNQVGVPVCCAEFTPQSISRHLDLSPACVVRSIEAMVTHVPGQPPVMMKSPGWMLNRSLFDRDLAASAVLKGARLSIQTHALGLEDGSVEVEQDGKRRRIRPRVVIGADGPHSTIGLGVSGRQLRQIVALQYEVVMAPRGGDSVHIFFDTQIEGGYAWFFPKGKTANAGLGVVPGKAAILPALLDRFLQHCREEDLIGGVEIIGKTAGSVPCEISSKSVFGNVLLAGDAAGHAHPISGAGILNAVLGGKMAGEAAAEAIIRNDPGHLKRYEAEWRSLFGNSLFYGALKRKDCEKNWKEEDFDHLVRRTWVGFKEYYRDRRKMQVP
jgi:digeranylgeranylglycerophospholipid reductase